MQQLGLITDGTIRTRGTFTHMDIDSECSFSHSSVEGSQSFSGSSVSVADFSDQDVTRLTPADSANSVASLSDEGAARDHFASDLSDQGAAGLDSAAGSWTGSGLSDLILLGEAEFGDNAGAGTLNGAFPPPAWFGGSHYKCLVLRLLPIFS